MNSEIIDRISLKLINLVLLVMLWVVITKAQPNSVGATGYIATGSADSGNTRAIGLCAEITHDVTSGLAVLTGEACYDNGAKAYIGDGHNWRARGEAHLYITRDADKLRPYALGGVNWAEQVNSQYSKGIVNYYVGGGLNYRNRVFAQAEYLLPEHSTLNTVSAIRGKAYFLHPLAPKWSLKMGGELTSTKFYQPNGVLMGWHRALSYQAFGGVLRMNNAVNDSRPTFTPNAAVEKKMPPMFVQSFLYSQETGQQIAVSKSWTIYLPALKKEMK